MFHSRTVSAATIAAMMVIGPVSAAESKDGLTRGAVELKSAGPLAFGPSGILFIADPLENAVVAVDTGDHAAAAEAARPKVESLDKKIASLLGIEAKELIVNDLAVNPISGNAYLSVTRGKGKDARPVVLYVDRAGKIHEFALKDVPFSRVALTHAPEDKKRQESITHLAFLNNKLIIAGLSSEEFASKLRWLAFPFEKDDNGSSVEIYHGSHGKIETNAPVRTFAVYDIDGKPNVLAAYTCTPLVKIPLSDLKPGEKVRGTTVAELGNHNRPIDIVIYKKGDKDFALIANNNRGVIKVNLENVGKAEAITSPVKDTAGLTYETISGLKGVVQLERFDKDHAIILVDSPEAGLTLSTIELP